MPRLLITGALVLAAAMCLPSSTVQARMPPPHSPGSVAVFPQSTTTTPPAPPAPPPPPPPFCQLPEALKGWAATDGCNSEPQFLSAFCSDHVSLTPSALECRLDNSPCAASGSSCSSRQTAGTSLTSRDRVFYGNFSFVARTAAGSGVTTTLVAYGSQGSIGWGFDGGKANQTSLTMGNQHPTVPLPFDPAADFHRYDVLWTAEAVAFFVDGEPVFNSTSGAGLPTDSMPLWAFVYACGASYCTPFRYNGPSTLALAAVAYTPEDGKAVACSNPPPPPAFCDRPNDLQLLYTALGGCDGADTALCPSHVQPGAQGTVLRLDTNTTGCTRPASCSAATVAAGMAAGPSLVHFGSISALLVLPVAARAAVWLAVLDALPSTKTGAGGTPLLGMAVLGDGSKGGPTQAQLRVGNSSVTVPLPAVASGGEPRNFSIAWHWTNVTFFFDGTALHTFTAGGDVVVPLGRLPMAVGLSACGTSSSSSSGWCGSTTSNNISASAVLVGAQYTPLGQAAAACAPRKLKKVWSEDFAGSALGPSWTVYDNCTHGQEEELYVPEGVSVADGLLRLTAFVFPDGNRTSRAGREYRFGSGWVDTASANGSQALSDCRTNNTAGFSLLYGRWEVRARLPKGHFWPAIWFMPAYPDCWPTGGEVDLMEAAIWLGQTLPYKVQSTYHWSASVCSQDHGSGLAYAGCPGCDFSADFHVYRVDLSPRAIVFSIDNNPFFSVGQVLTGDTLPKHPMYLILGNQLWQHWNYTEDLPSVFEIDSVEAWEVAE